VALGDSVRLAVGTLTILPTGAIRNVDRGVAGPAMLIAPLAVLPLALVAAAAGWCAQLVGWPSLVRGILVVGVLALGTRALHLDGLADTVDGLGTGWDRDKALAVMRAGDVGPMGVAALVLVLIAQIVAIGALPGGWRGAVCVAALIFCSRASLSLVCLVGVPAARPDGLGAAVAGSVGRVPAVASWLLVTAVLALLFAWEGQPWWLGVVAALAAVMILGLLVRRCVRRFGGVTGDVMGAAVESTFTVLVLMAAR
jgi:adenosylcobinamide-GDP ribazoletransferase